MKKLIYLIAIASASSVYARSFDCKGVYDDNKGTSATLEMNGKTISVDGTAVAGDGFTADISCVGTKSDRKDAKYNVYTTNERKCSVSYVKISNDLYESGSGFMVLARTSGGDTHDSSGYAYRWYHCGN